MNNITLSSVISVLILVAAIFITLFVIVETAKRIKAWIIYKMTPIKTIHARIVDTHIDLTYRSYPDGPFGSSSLGPATECCITFETDEHEKLDLCVANKDYAVFEIGDSGMLTFRKDAFISFEKDGEQIEQNMIDL